MTPLCVVGAIIGTQLIVTLGITTNTSLIGALAGMALGRLPLAYLSRYKSVHLQNLAQSAISAATFGAGNALLLPVGIPFVMGRPDLVEPMLLGVFLAMLVDGYMLYRMFDSEVFPASGAWPPGVAAAEAIRAGDEGGRKLGVLGLGVIIGIVGSLFKIPMSAFGVAFIGNIWALIMFGVGLLVAQLLRRSVRRRDVRLDLAGRRSCKGVCAARRHGRRGHCRADLGRAPGPGAGQGPAESGRHGARRRRGAPVARASAAWPMSRSRCCWRFWAGCGPTCRPPCSRHSSSTRLSRH